MHHELRAGAAVGAVKCIRIAEIERQIVLRVRIHLAGGDVVETLRRLPVAFLDLGSELAGPAADRIGLRERVAALAVLLPDFQLGLFLEHADQDRRFHLHVLGLDFLDHLVGERPRRFLAHRQDAEAVGVAAGQRGRRAERGRTRRARTIGLRFKRNSPKKGQGRQSPSHHAFVIPKRAENRKTCRDSGDQPRLSMGTVNER